MQRENWQPHDTNTNRNLVPVYTIQGLLYIAIPWTLAWTTTEQKTK